MIVVGIQMINLHCPMYSFGFDDAMISGLKPVEFQSNIL